MVEPAFDTSKCGFEYIERLESFEFISDCAITEAPPPITECVPTTVLPEPLPLPPAGFGNPGPQGPVGLAGPAGATGPTGTCPEQKYRIEAFDTLGNKLEATVSAGGEDCSIDISFAITLDEEAKFEPDYKACCGWQWDATGKGWTLRWDEGNPADDPCEPPDGEEPYESGAGGAVPCIDGSCEGEIFQRCPPFCLACDEIPREVTLNISGLTNETDCTGCADLNGDHTLTRLEANPCVWMADPTEISTCYPFGTPSLYFQMLDCVEESTSWEVGFFGGGPAGFFCQHELGVDEECCEGGTCTSSVEDEDGVLGCAWEELVFTISWT